MSSKVVLLRYVKTSRGWRRVRVKEEGTRKGRGWTKDWNDPQSYGTDCQQLGEFQLKWYVAGGRARYAGAGSDLREAVTQQERKQTLLDAEAAAAKAGVELVPEDPARKSLQGQMESFVRMKELAGRDRETVSAYRNLIGEFLQVSGKLYSDQIVEMDMLEFCDALRRRGLSERTVQNYYGTRILPPVILSPDPAGE